MNYIVFLKKSVEEELEYLQVKLYDKIVKSIVLLKNNPRPRNAKKLYGGKGYRIRVGDYRVLYTINDLEKKVEVYSVAHRKEVYR